MGVPQGGCPQPNCKGTIIDGYCNLCGQPPIVKQVATVLGTKVTGAGSGEELGMVQIGSSRVEPNSNKKPRAASPSRRTRIGAGITQVPPAPAVDPAKAVLTDPVVPENRRNCANCGEPVGRATTASPTGETFGDCANCGSHFDFRPAIAPGELVGGQYQVAGCLAYGGMGWIYLARDKNVSDRWVVLKGLLNVNDQDAAAATKSEGEFLAQVEHPLIVEIYNFVEHGAARYIVMEYVPGRSLTDLLKQRKKANNDVLDPLPVDWALAYLIEILPAFTYMHAKQLVYCDFKPDNLMQVGDAVKLIDLGAVRRLDDDTSPIFGTVGYQAPEIGDETPSIASDIYTLGRSLVVLCSDFRGFQTEYVHSLPPAYQLPQFDTYDSLYRLAQRACAKVPEDRFQSAEALRLQALGVLREVVGRSSGGAALTSQISTLFTGPNVLDEETLDWRALPQLRADAEDPMREWLTAMQVDDPSTRFNALRHAPQRTPAVVLAQMELSLQMGDIKQVDALVAELLKSDPWEWRAIWVAGLAQVQAGNWHDAVRYFNTVYSQLPGELAPKFALAAACERAEKIATAEELYAVCAATDAAYVTPCAFGLARVRSASNNVQGTLDALALVPPTSRAYRVARQQRARILLDRGNTIQDLAAALDSVRAAGMDPPTAASFEVDILERALKFVRQHGNQTTMLDGDLATERNIRPKLEQAYHKKAAWSQDSAERTQLLSNADATRRWSLW